MARKATRRLTPEEQMGKKKRLILFGCAGAVALVLVILLGVYAALHGGPALPRSVQKRAEQAASAGSQNTPSAPGAVPSAPLSPTAAAAIPPGTAPLKQQLAQVQYAGQTGDSRPQTLYVSDSELNGMIAESFKADKHLREVRAYFGPGKAYIVGAVVWQGQNLSLTVTAEPVIVNGGVRFGIQSVNVGSMSAPAAVTQRIQEQANKNSGKLDPARTGIYVDRIDIREGVAILSGKAVPKTQ